MPLARNEIVLSRASHTAAVEHSGEVAAMIVSHVQERP